VIRNDAQVVASELVANAVVHARTDCRLALRYRTRGLTVAVWDRSPDRLPAPRPFDASEDVHGLLVVAALTLHWESARRRDEKCVWAFLPAVPAAASAGTRTGRVHAAVQEAVRVALAHGVDSADADAAIRRLVAGLAEQHGLDFLRDLVAELVAELAEVTATIRPRTGRTWLPDHSGPNAGDPGSP
jgi:hypothetical protein